MSMHSRTSRSSLVLSKLLHKFFSCGHVGSSSRFGLADLKAQKSNSKVSHARIDNNDDESYLLSPSTSSE